MGILVNEKHDVVALKASRDAAKREGIENKKYAVKELNFMTDNKGKTYIVLMKNDGSAIFVSDNQTVDKHELAIKGFKVVDKIITTVPKRGEYKTLIALDFVNSVSEFIEDFNYMAGNTFTLKDVVLQGTGFSKLKVDTEIASSEDFYHLEVFQNTLIESASEELADSDAKNKAKQKATEQKDIAERNRAAEIREVTEETIKLKE